MIAHELTRQNYDVTIIHPFFTEIFKSAIQPVRSSKFASQMSHRFLFSRMSDIKSNWLSRYLANPIVKEYQCQLGEQSLCYSETMTEIKEILANRITLHNYVI